MRQGVIADTTKFKEKSEIRAGNHTLLIWEFCVIIIETRCTVLRGEAIGSIFFQGAMHPWSASSAVGCGSEKPLVSGINSRLLTITHQRTARHAITQCHWN